MPPFVGVAVNVTEEPEQIVVAEAAIETEGTTVEFTVITTELDVTGEPVAQVELEVIITVTVCPLVNVVEVNVGELVPTLLPFTCH